MKIFVDADACPVLGIIEKTAAKYKIEVFLICDTNHIMNSSYSTVKVISAGPDAVDFALVNLCSRGDIVVTQDYGVASMALGRGSYCIHQSGKWYTAENIDGLLNERYINKKARMSSAKNHVKGPRKRTHDDDVAFEVSFEKLINYVIGKDV